ncbi:MAG: ABC transporter ATP-binding protein [Sphaerobacter thermophilus]|uniref:ABC transporter ATP-binding protein n=1 Tax=Sphaerobacter thermophilus TaxID=2057 RepID=UPI000DB4C32D|nr:MAG: ABC transporter [Sphaerobacter thermophilus]
MQDVSTPVTNGVAVGATRPAVIEARGLVKRYGDFTAVNGVDLTVYDGEIFGILGPNGAGKTTTLEMIEGLREPDEGTIHVAGIDAARNPTAVKRVIGVQLQSTALFDHLTVRELIALFAALYGADTSKAKVDRLVELVSLQEKANDYANALSGGQQQRLSIALAMVNDPRIIFLDEPTTGLDPAARRNLWDVIRTVRAGGKTVVLTTHYMEEAEVLCDRVAVMDQGRIIACDTPRRLIDQLDQAATIRARIDNGTVPVETFKSLPNVTHVAVEDGYVELHSDDMQVTMSALLATAREAGLRLDNLSTSSATLEDVFLALTGRSLRE